MRTVLTILAVTILAALTVLTGCGGGGGGGSVPTPAVMPGSPEMEIIPEHSGIENIAGVDIRDTWKSPEPIKSYFGLSGDGNLPRFEGIDSSQYSILGSKDGITYAQRMSGPTDTIDIDFIGDFDGYFDSLPDYVRGTIERAGKAWSHRLKDVLGPFMSTDSVVTRKGRDENGWTIPRLVDGILLDFETDFENPKWDFEWGYSRGFYRYEQIEGKDFTVRTGWIEVAAGDINRGPLWFAYLAAHEIGHAIGHGIELGRTDTPETIERYIDYERGVWTGPNLTAANGGRNVAFQPGHEGKSDFGHLGACEMIMSYCGAGIAIPHEMDFAYMKDIGYTVADDYPTEPEAYSYGAWAQHSAWVVTSARIMTFSPTRITDYITVEADVYGNPAFTNFADAHTGTLTWNGSLLASDMASFAPVFGEAEIVLSADTLDGTVQFMNLRSVVDVEAQAQLTGWRKSSLAYDVTVEENGFTDTGGKVMGRFYGPNHEEAAGILDDAAEKILGAFGGIR